MDARLQQERRRCLFVRKGEQAMWAYLLDYYNEIFSTSHEMADLSETITSISPATPEA